MITRFNIRKVNDSLELIEYLNKQHDFDFYYINNGKKVYPSNIKELKIMRKECEEFWVLKDVDIQGVIAVWASEYNNRTYYYVKVTANTINDAQKLLDIISWNCKKDVCVKLNKRNRFLKSFYYKGYKFKSNNGKYVILTKKLK